MLPAEQTVVEGYATEDEIALGEPDLEAEAAQIGLGIEMDDRTGL